MGIERNRLEIKDGKVKGRKIGDAVMVVGNNGFPNQPGLLKGTLAAGPIEIGTILSNLQVDTLIIDEALTPIFRRDFLQKQLRERNLVLGSAMSAHLDATLRWLRYAQRMNRGCVTVVGGMGATQKPRKALEEGADIVVMGEGELVLEHLIGILRDGGDLNEVPGVAWLEDGNPFKTARPPLIADLDTIPIGRQDLVFEGWRATAVSVGSSRGCPFGCSFCSVGGTFGRQHRRMSAGRVLEHIEAIQCNYRRVYGMRQHIGFICDDDVASNSTFAKELFQLMAERDVARRKGINFSAETRVPRLLDRELLRSWKRAGGNSFFCGFESITDESLSIAGKAQSVAQMEEACAAAFEAKINIRAMLVAGLDGDKPGFGKRTALWCKKNRIALMVLYMRSALPGTDDTKFLQEEDRIIPGIPDAYRYDGAHPCFKPKEFSASQLIEEWLEAMHIFYNCRRIIERNSGFSWMYRLYWAWCAQQVKNKERELVAFAAQYL